MPQPYTLIEGEGQCEYLEDRRRPHGKVDYKYRLTGAHQGEPIDIWMIEPGEDVDEDGRHVVFERLVWADDESLFADDLTDAYNDVLREELEITARETWD
jgi:hypothetical protein